MEKILRGYAQLTVSPICLPCVANLNKRVFGVMRSQLGPALVRAIAFLAKFSAFPKASEHFRFETGDASPLLAGQLNHPTLQ
jgi:hypothetical protein